MGVGCRPKGWHYKIHVSQPLMMEDRPHGQHCWELSQESPHPPRTWACHTRLRAVPLSKFRLLSETRRKNIIYFTVMFLGCLKKSLIFCFFSSDFWRRHIALHWYKHMNFFDARYQDYETTILCQSENNLKFSFLNIFLIIILIKQIFIQDYLSVLIKRTVIKRVL